MAIAIRAQQTSVTASDTTSHTIAMPTHSTGDRLVLLASFDGADTTITAGMSGWTSIFNGERLVAYEKVAASGSEPGVSVTSSASEQMAAVVYSISGAHASTASEYSQVTHNAIDGTTYPFSNLAISGWSGEETLFISGLGWDRSSSTTLPSAGYSTGFAELTANFTSSGLSGASGIVTQYRIVNANSQDPSDWTGSASRASTNFVIAVRPAGGGSVAPIVAYYQSMQD